MGEGGVARGTSRRILIWSGVSANRLRVENWTVGEKDLGIEIDKRLALKDLKVYVLDQVARYNGFFRRRSNSEVVNRGGSDSTIDIQ